MTRTSQFDATTPTSAGVGFVAVLRDLTGTLLGALVAWGLTCALAGAIPVLISEGGMIEPAAALGFAWMLHLVIAGIGLWGIAFVLLHVWCLHTLIYTDDCRSRALAGAFLSQLTVSVIATALLTQDISTYAIVAWAVANGLLLPLVLRPLFGGGAGAVRDHRTVRAGDYEQNPRPEAMRRRDAKEKLPRFARKRIEEQARVTRILRSKVRSHYSAERATTNGTSHTREGRIEQTSYGRIF